VGVSAGYSETDSVVEAINEWGLTDLVNLIDSDGTVWGNFDIFSTPAVAFVNTNGEVSLHMGPLFGDAFYQFVEDHRA
jgi:hypothetical protein